MSTTSSSFSPSLSLRQLSRTIVCFAIVITIMNFLILGVIFSHESSSSVSSSSSPIQQNQQQNQQQQHNTNPMMMMQMVKQQRNPGDGLHHDGEEHDEIEEEEGEEKLHHEKNYGGTDDLNSRRINENNKNNNIRRGNNINININNGRHDRDDMNKTQQQQHQQKHVYHKKLPILQDDEEESMSACLLTMDDNHFLIEWIAYHYYVCRLRHLIVAIDPRSSRELPTEIFDRWSEFGLIIEVWDDPDKYLFGDYEKRIIKRGQKNWDMEPLSDPHLSRHRERQSEFYFSCIKSLKRQNLGWTLLIDTDEYIYVNPAIKDPNNHDLYLEKWSKLPTISQEGSVLQMLLGLKFPSTKYSLDFPCVPLNRRQFSSREIEQEEANDDDEKQRQQQLLNNINLTQNQFQTLQYMLWGWFDKYHPKLAGKAAIDLKRLRLEDIDHPANKGRIDPHQPLKTICPSENVFLSERHTLLIVNHYMGSREQWESRKNDARGLACLSKLYDHQNNILGEHTLTIDDDISPWLTGFVDYVGISNATKLLKDSGVVAPLIQSTYKSSTKNIEDDHRNQKKKRSKATTTNSTNIVNMYELVSKIAPIGLHVRVMEDNDDDETNAEERWQPDVGTIIASNCRGGYDIKFNDSTWVWAYGLPYIKRAYNNSQDVTLYDEAKSIFDIEDDNYDGEI